MPATLRIFHVFRAPVGGLFRHVHDVTRAQAQAGHAVGIICDSMTGSATTERMLAALAPQMTLGIHRLPMFRNPHPSDTKVLARVRSLEAAMQPDVLHGHGAKGGVYARMGGLLPGKTGPIRCYTPHGGSLNFYPGSISHKIFMRIERLLEFGTDLFLFESQFIRERYEEFVCVTRRPARLARNGLYPHEFDPVAPLETATDFLYVGEFREAKGIDVLVDAMKILDKRGIMATLTLVGSGPSEAKIRARIEEHGLSARVSWRGVTPAAEAFRLGRIMIVASRFESLPYIVLEAVAGAVPIISTNVGGIPEILPADYPALIQANDAEALAQAMARMLALAPKELQAQAAALSQLLRGEFTLARMLERIEGGYREAMAQRRR